MSQISKITLPNNEQYDIIDSTIPEWARNETKPSYTADEVGLGNVGNFKAVSTEANQELTDDEKANARKNIGAEGAAFSGSYNDLTDKPFIPAIDTTLKVSNAAADAEATGTAIEAKYTKPTDGIPKTDLEESVQTSLEKANTALQSFTESDPVFVASAAHDITSSDISNWNNKGTYSKPTDGIPKTDLDSSVQSSLDKADSALQSYTETDPIFTKSAASGITSTDISNWNAKYDKPDAGIPKTDLAQAVQTSLGLADTALQSHQDISKKADLDDNGLVLTSQLPSYVDDVLEYESKDSFPTIGETGKIYVDISTNLTYRWSGSTYTEISPSLALGTTASTAYYGDKGKTAYDHSQVTSGNPHKVTASDVGLGSVGNFKAVSTVASQGLTDTEKSNARTNIEAGTYSKPTDGIPKSDLTSAVQTSLGLADTALQSHQDISGKVNKTGDTMTGTLTAPNVTITGSDGFNFSGISAATDDIARPVWFSYGEATNKTFKYGVPKYDTDFAYNPNTNTLTVANISGNASSATTAASCTGNAATATSANTAKQLQTYKYGSTTETYGTSYPIWAQWDSTGKIVNLKCTNYTVNVDTVNNHTVATDVPSSAVFTDTTYSATSPISLNGTTFSHATSGVTAGSYGDSAAQTPAYGGTFNVPYITVNATGHVTGISSHTVKIPASDNVDTKVTQSSTTTSDWRNLLLKSDAVSTSTTAITSTTAQTYAAVGISAQPSTGTIRATNYNVADGCTMQYDSTNKCINFVFA